MNTSTKRVKPSFPMPATASERKREKKETREVDALNGLRRVFRSLQLLQKRHRLLVLVEFVYALKLLSIPHNMFESASSRLHYSHSHQQHQHQHQHQHHHPIRFDTRSIASAGSNSLLGSLSTLPGRFHRRVRLRSPPLCEPFHIRPPARSSAAAFACSAIRALDAVERAAGSGSAAAIASAHRSRACTAIVNSRGWELTHGRGSDRWENAWSGMSDHNQVAARIVLRGAPFRRILRVTKQSKTHSSSMLTAPSCSLAACLAFR